MKSSTEQASADSATLDAVRDTVPEECALPVPVPLVERQHRQMPIEQLLKTLEVDLIPRLLVSHLEDGSSYSVDAELSPAPGEWCKSIAIEQFSIWCVEQDNEAVHRHVSRLLAANIGLDSIYLHLLAPVAKLLGHKWEEDLLTFVDVSLGLCCLHRLLCDCESIGFNRPTSSESHAILLSATPGDQHTFGIAMAADFYRRYGWQVNNVSGCDVEALLSELKCTPYAALGLSLHTEEHYDRLCATIRSVRRLPRNQQLLIIVGGNFFLANPSMVGRCGADLVATDGHKAVLDTKAALQLSMNTA